MLVLSLFRGLGLMDRAFEDEGFCLVAGPDLLWGGDVKRFHVPAGRFDGVIGGPPCQLFSRLIAIVRHNGYREGEDLIPEFERIVAEARPAWFLMENVDTAPVPTVAGYVVDPTILDNRWLGETQSRRHRLSFGTPDGRRLHYQLAALEAVAYDYRVCASDFRRTHPVKLLAGRTYRKGALSLRAGRSLAECCELQGLPRDFFAGSPFTLKAAGQMLGNGMPYRMARECARAVREALGG